MQTRDVTRICYLD